jgi:acetyl-CoA carboxylase beta subunit
MARRLEGNNNKCPLCDEYTACYDPVSHANVCKRCDFHEEVAQPKRFITITIAPRRRV